MAPPLSRMAFPEGSKALVARWLPLVLLSLSGLALAAFLSVTGLYQRVDYWAHDAKQQWLGSPVDLSGVVVFDVDEESMTRLEPQLGPWPYERDIYALVTRYLLSGEARSVVFDVLFSEARSGDADFARELNPRVVIAGAALPFPFERSAAYRNQLERVALKDAGTLPSRLWSDITLPLDIFTRSGARVGVISVQPDEDGVLRRIALLHRAYERRLPALTFAGLLAAEPDAVLSGEPGRISLGDRDWKVNDKGEIAIRFPSNVRQLEIQPFYKLALAAAGAPGYESVRDSIRGKVVFVGSSSAVLGDFAHTPLGRMPGLYLNAYAHAALEKGAVIRPGGLALDVMLFIIFMLPALVLRARIALVRPREFAAGASVLVMAAAASGAILGASGIDSAWLAAVLAGAITLLLAAFEWEARLYRERQRLELGRRAALEAARLKTEFLNYMTHELRTPIASIKGFNRVNQDDIGAEARIKNTGIIARACDHLLALVNNNLDLAKMEAGQMVIDTRPEEVRMFAADVIATMEALARDKSLELALDIGEEVPAALVIDVFRLKQILLNLISNAIKYTPSGKVTLRLRWDQGWFTLSVHDTGPGMDQDTLARIFEPFRQDGSAASSRSGTGLGLAITRRLAGLMGGEIEASSTPGEGSVFSVRIQAARAELAQAAPTPTATKPALPAQGKLSGRVLLADDDEDLRGLFEMHLGALGLEVTAVENGHLAVEAVLAHPYACIIMDMQMPVLDGFGAASAMRAAGFRGGILGLTAHDDPGILQKARDAGCTRVLTKPVTRSQLREALSPYFDAAADQPVPAKEVMA